MFIKCDVKAWAKKRFFELYPDQKLKRKRFDKEEEKLILCFTKILEHWVGYN